MKCKNKVVEVLGFKGDYTGKIVPAVLQLIITNDNIGKTLSVNDGNTQFTFSFKPIERYLK